MGYWGGVAKQAWRETRGEVRLDTPVRLILAVGSPLFVMVSGWAFTRQLPLATGLALGWLAFVGAVTFLAKLTSVPPRLAAETQAANDELGARLAAATAASADYDMTIRALFFHINPDALNAEEKTWQTVGRDVMDAFSTERLECWGRQIIGTRRTALQKIEHTFWPHAKFTHFFLAEGDDQSLHATDGLGQYTDLRVSRAQVERVWPRP